MTNYTDADIEDLTRWTAEELRANTRRWRDARAAGPLVKNSVGNAGVIRHADVCPLLRDKRLRGMGMDFDRMIGIPEDSRTWRFHQHFTLFMNGDDHARVRGLVAKAFTPRAVAFLPPPQPLAFVAGFASVAPFLWLAKSVDEYNTQVARVFQADVVALLCLIVGAVAYAMR